MADEFDTLVQQIIINDAQAIQSLANFSNSLTMTYQKIDGLQALINVVSKQMGISFDAAKLKLTELNNAFYGSNVSSMGGEAPGSFAFDPELLDRVSQSTNRTTDAYRRNLTVLGGMSETLPNASNEIKQLGDNFANTANKGKQVPPVLENTGAKATGLMGALGKLGSVFYHVWTAMMAFQVVQWALSLVQGIGAATEAAQAFYKSLVNIEMGIRAMRRAGIDVTMKDAMKTISEFTALFPVISKPAMTDALDNIILKTAKMGLSWQQVSDILRVAAGVYAVTGKSMENTSDAIVNAMVSSSGNMTKSLLEATNLQVNSQMIETKARELNIANIEKGVAALTAEERARTVLAVVMDQYLAKQDDITASMETVPAKIDAVNKAWENMKTNMGLLFLEIKANFAPQILELINLLEWLTDVAKNTFIFQKTAGEIAMGAVTKVESTRSGFSPEELLRMNPRFSEYKDIDKTTEAWRQYTTALEKAIATGKLMGISGKLPNEIVATQMKIMNSEGGEYGKLYAQEFTKALAETIANEGYESAFGSGVVIGEAIVAGLKEGQNLIADPSLVAAKATATEILKLKFAGLDEAQQAELDIAQDTANQILAIKDRALKEEEQAALDVAKKTADELTKISLENLRKALVDRTSWEVMYTNAKDATERTGASLDMLGGMLQGLSEDGATVWNEFLKATGEISPAAVKAFLEITAMFNEMKRMLEMGMTIPVIVEWFMTGTTGINDKGKGLSGTQDPNWYDIGQVPSAPGTDFVPMGTKNGPGTGGAWYNPTTEQWHFGPPGGDDTKWKQGGDFVIPPGFNENFPIGYGSSGERVTITPASAMAHNPGYGGITTAPSGAKGSGGDVSIVVNNPIPRAAEDSIHREYISINYLGIT